MKQLNDAELAFIGNAMSVAAERYRYDASVMRRLGHTQLADQFDRQEKEATEFSVAFGSSPEVVMTNCRGCEESPTGKCDQPQHCADAPFLAALDRKFGMKRSP